MADSPTFHYSTPSAVSRGKGKLTNNDRGAELVGELPDSRSRIDRFLDWFNYGTEQSAKLRDRMIEDLKFLNNDQYTEAERTYLTEQKRPSITINFSTGIVNSVLGVESRSRTETKLLPFEPNDAANADAFGVLLKGVEKKISRKRKNSKVFKFKAGPGLGWQKLSYDFTRRSKGEISLEVLSPLEVVWDPNYPDCEWQQAKWVMHAKYRTLDSLITQFPEWEDEIRTKWGEWLRPSGGATEQLGDSQQKRRSFWDPETQRVQLLEVWYKEFVEMEVAETIDGEVITDPAKVAAFKEAAKQVGEEVVTFEDRMVEKVFVAWVLDDIELDHIESPLPFDELPLCPFLGHYWWEEPFGLMALMKDAQKEKNKRRMNIAEVAGRTARSGWKVVANSLVDRQQVELFSAGAGSIIEYHDGKEPKEIQPPPIDQNLMTLERWATEELPLTVSLNKEALGQADAGTQSGKAFEAKARTGMLSQETLFDTYTDELEWVTKLLIKMIKDNISEAEAARIIGRVALEDPMDEMAAQFSQNGGRLAEILSDAFNTEYDVVITTKPYEPSYELAKFNSLMEMNRQGVPVPPQIAVKAAMDAGLIDKKNGMDWLTALAPPPPVDGMGGMGGPSPFGPEMPTTPQGVDDQVAMEGAQF